MRTLWLRTYRNAGLCLLLCAALALLSGCSIRPPTQPNSAENEVSFAEAVKGALSPEEAQPDEGEEAPSSTPVPARAAENVLYRDIETVDLFLDATRSMMGFADTKSISLYEKTIDAAVSSIAQVFPNARRSVYRADVSRSDPEDARIAPEQVVQQAMQPWFYLVEPYLRQPERVKLLGAQDLTEGQRMNQFLPSYYQQAGQSLPEGTAETDTPVDWAIRNLNKGGSRVGLILTDLSELQNHTGTLSQTLREQIFAQGETIGLLAIYSEFSGFVPVHGIQETWYEWGSVPSGSPEKQLDYGYYTLGLTIAEADREEALRPFYVLCIGESDVVNDFLAVLEQQLSALLGGEEKQSRVFRQVFDVDFAQAFTEIQRTVTISGQSTAGVNVGKQSGGMPGPGFVQLQRVQEGQSRTVEFALTYLPKDSDPRIGTFVPDDFVAQAVLYPLDEGGGKGGEAIASLDPAVDLSIRIGQLNNAEKVEILLETAYPTGAIPKGDYLVEITLSLMPPSVKDAQPWVDRLNADLTHQQQTTAFDGSRTIGLTGLINALTGMQESMLAQAELGSFSFPLYVVAE